MDDPERARLDLVPDDDPAVVPEQHEEHGSSSSTAPAVHLLALNAITRPSRDDDNDGPDEASRNFYTSAQWTPDGTSLLASSSRNTVSTFVLPDDLLDPDVVPRRLEPQSVVTLPEPTQTVTPAPYFSLAEPSSQSALVTCRDHPLHLYHLFPPADAPNIPMATYKLIRRETEEYITPSSLVWNLPGTHFLCGSANRLDYFDVTRHGSDGPLLTIPTIPSKRHVAKGHGVGMKGVVSALAALPPDTNSSSLIAAGTRTRWIGLYDLHRTDKAVANFSVANAQGLDPSTAAAVAGQGIVQVRWSPCGRYLVVNERQSRGLLVYDIRGTGQLLSALVGRDAASQQKLTLDVFPDGDSSSESPFFEVWAGSRDGSVAVWEAVGSQVGAVEPAWRWDAHGAPVGSTAVHSSGSVVATCSGGWGSPTARDINEVFGTASSHPSSQKVFDESELRVWAIGG